MFTQGNGSFQEETLVFRRKRLSPGGDVCLRVETFFFKWKPVADPAIGVGRRRRGGVPLALCGLCRKFGTPLNENFKRYMNHCHRDCINIVDINMQNSLFTWLILFDVFDELQFCFSNFVSLAPP